MRDRVRLRVLDRRAFVLSAISGAALLKSLKTAKAASEDDDRRTLAFWNTYRALIQEAEPEESLVTLVLDELIENGNNVPFEINVESPMQQDDYIRTLHLLSTANPQPAVAAFHFTPQSGKASVKGRMRLARTQDVVALAERSDGKLFVATKRIEVTIGGCGN